MILSVTYSTTSYPNILTSGATFGKKVCIVAPGPNGVNHYNAIPNDFSIIVVNKAVLIEALQPDWWVIAHDDTSWFPKADKLYRGRRIYRDAIVPNISETANKLSQNHIYQFETAEEHLQENKIWPVKGHIRKGASVSSLSVQLAYNMGATEILLCGVDMSGNGYWDRSENESPEALSIHGEVWDSVSRFNPLLNHMRNELGIQISTLSETQLDVPFYQRS